MQQQVTISVVDKTQRALTNINRRLGSLQKGLLGVNGLATAAAAAFAGFATGRGISSIISATQAMEGFRTQLTTYLGSQQLANAEIERLSKLARSLPQDVNQLTEAFVIFQRFGLDTSNDSMKAFSNIAAANSKSITQLGEAVADALTGEFERLKEFGIKVSKENGKFVARIGEDQVAVSASTKDLVEQLKALGAEGGRFGNVAIGPLTLAMSNFRGAIFETSAALGEGGLGLAISDTLTGFTDLLTKNDEAVDKIGNALTKAFLYAKQGALFVYNNIELLAKGFAIFLGLKAAVGVAQIATALAGPLVTGVVLATKAVKALTLALIRNPLIALGVGLAVIIEKTTGALSGMAEELGLIGEDSVLDNLVKDGKELAGTIAGPVVDAVRDFDTITESVNEQFAEIKKRAEENNKTLSETEAALLKQELTAKAIAEAETGRATALQEILDAKYEELRVAGLSEEQQLRIKLIKEAEKKLQGELNDQEKERFSVLARETLELEKQRDLRQEVIEKNQQLQKDIAQTGIDLAQKYNDQSLKFEIARLEEVRDTAESFARSQFELGLTTEKEYQDARLGIAIETENKINQVRSQALQERLSNELQKEMQNSKLILARKLDDTQISVLQQQGASERAQAITQERIDFEKKSEAEKYQFAAGKASSFFADLARVNKKFARAAKAAAIVEATINTYVGATKALASYPPPFNFIAAAAVVASGLAQVATIRAQTAQRGGTVIGGQTALVGEDGPELIVPKQSSTVIPREVADAVNNLGGGRSEPVTVNFNIQANDTAGFDQLITQRRGLIVNLINTALNERGKAGITS